MKLNPFKAALTAGCVALMASALVADPGANPGKGKPKGEGRPPAVAHARPEAQKAKNRGPEFNKGPRQQEKGPRHGDRGPMMSQGKGPMKGDKCPMMANGWERTKFHDGGRFGMRRNWNRRMMGTMPMYQQGGWGSPTIIVIPMCQHCGAGCPMMGMNGNAPRHGMAMHRGFGPKGGRPYMNGRGMMNGPDRRRHWKHGKDKNDCSCDRCKCGGDDDDDRRFKKGKKRDQWKQDKYEKPGKERRKDRPRRGRDDY